MKTLKSHHTFDLKWTKLFKDSCDVAGMRKSQDVDGQRSHNAKGLGFEVPMAGGPCAVVGAFRCARLCHDTNVQQTRMH